MRKCVFMVTVMALVFLGGVRPGFAFQPQFLFHHLVLTAAKAVVLFKRESPGHLSCPFLAC
jgi:NADH:ubiquinone oxidoreductase subunit H